jgi:hypothetical protein
VRGGQPCQNVLQNGFRSYQHVVVPISNQSEAKRFQLGRPLLVVSALRRMLPTVDLDDQPSFDTDEISDVTSKRILPPELESTQPPVAKAPPEPRFRVGLDLP